MERNFTLDPCSTARQFLGRLRPVNWSRGGWSLSWIFRGLGKEDYELMPSAWRWHKDKTSNMSHIQVIYHLHREYIRTHLSKFMISAQQLVLGNPILAEGYNYFSEIDESRIVNLLAQALAEHLMLTEFRDMLDVYQVNQGNYYSANSSNDEFIINYIASIYQLVHLDQVNQNWSGSTVAIAQHHGIPTRLLDWTLDPMVAMYFAASNMHIEAKEISVVAVPFDSFRESNSVQLIKVPSTTSKYIHSQSGIFSLDPKSDLYYLEHGRFPVTDERVKGAIKVTLPAWERKELLRLLWLEKATRASMMPTIDNVVETLKYKWDSDFHQFL